MRSRQLFVGALFAFALAGTSYNTCFAHPGHGGHGEFESGIGFVSGLLHPFLGMGDVLALIAVALLAVRMGGRGLWAVPVALIGSIALNLIGPVVGVALPSVVWPIFISIVLLSVLVGKSRVLCADRRL